MTLKSLIQRLLDSRTTPAEAIHADRINLYTESTFSADTFTAPRDGFVRVWAKVRDGVAGTALGLNVSTNGGEKGISRFAFTGPSAANDIVQTWPVQKGETIRIESFNLNIQARTFFDAIGGGYQALKNALLQGGVLCRLSRLYSSLQRSFLSVRRHGSATSLRPSYQGARKSPLPLTPILKTTQRRATELYVSIQMALRGQSSALLLVAGGSYFTARTKQEFIKRLRFLLQRVKRSTLISQRIKAPLVSSSFRPSVLNEVKGGASC